MGFIEKGLVKETQDYGVSTFLSVSPVLDLVILEQQIILEVCYSAHSWMRGISAIF